MALATSVNAHCGHAMILDCILVDVDSDDEYSDGGDSDGGEWNNIAFRFKNTDPNNKAIEIMANG